MFVSGCTHRCPGCFNEEAWDFNFGKPFTQETIDYIIDLLKPDFYKGITFLGGKAGLWPFIIIFCNMWQQTGYGSVVYFAAICGIDSSMVEAAEVDGATSWQRIRYIILPSLKGTFIILLLFALGGIMKGNFGLFWNLTGGANSQLFPTTDIIETFVYRTMTTQNNFATSSAVGLYQSIFGFVLVMFSNWVVKRLDPDYALF